MKEYQGQPKGQGQRFAIVASRYNEFVTSKLVKGAQDCFLEHGVAPESIELFWCPGALEIPAVAARIISQGVNCKFFGGIVCIGCVIRGDTDHYHHVCTQSVEGVSQLALSSQVAVGNAILTVENAQQAIQRSGEKSLNKGWEAALAAMEMADLYRQMK
jgi:6,7-dimethyl-8-ribityllumazine synthase